MVCNKKRKPVFIKRKQNHVVFSRVTILSFHPLLITIPQKPWCGLNIWFSSLTEHQNKLTVVHWVHHLMLTEIFLIWEKSNQVWLNGNACVCSYGLQHDLSCCPSWSVIKKNNWPFLILYVKYWMSSCTTCLIRNSDIPMSLVINLSDL